MKSKGDTTWMAVFMGFFVFAVTFSGLIFSPPVFSATTPNVQYKEELPEIKTNVPQLKKTEEKEEEGKKFDHNLTGFPLRGGHAWVPCEECHIRGVFRGTPRNCRGCHTRGLGTGGSRMPANHIPTTAECDLCHTVNRLGGTWNTVRMDHIGITSNCDICHNGRQAPGKNANHIPTTQSCDLCHRSTLSFTNVRMDHAGITADCVQCHNGRLAGGKNTGHIPTSQPCELCHKSTSSWNIVKMDHSGIRNTCQNCHNNPQFPFAGGWPTSPNCPNHAFFPPDCSTPGCHGTNFNTWDLGNPACP